MPQLFNPQVFSFNFALIATTVSVVSAFGVFLYQKSKRKRVPNSWVQIGKVTHLYIYPMKSGKKIAVKEAECTETGLQLITDDSVQLKDR